MFGVRAVRSLLSILALMCAALVIAVPIAGPSFAEDAAYTDDATAREAARLLRQLKAEQKSQPVSESPRVLRRQAVVAEGEKRHRDAAKLWRDIARANPAANPYVWLRFARAQLSIKPANAPEKSRLEREAAGAAYHGLSLADGEPRTQTAAMALLARVYERRRQYRPAINVLAAFLTIADDPTARGHYERLRAAHGFRIAGYTVDADSTSPRVCVQFSEPLSETQKSFDTFFSVDGQDPAAVAPEKRQVCLQGFVHGERYRIQVRAGLPSDVGEALEKTSDLTVYVRDRSPSVRFSGRNYVLPARGQQGLPVTSVNADAVAIEVLRIGDRGLASAVVDGTIGRRLSDYSTRDLLSRQAVSVWSGTLDIVSKLNDDVTTAFPVTETLGTLEPGVYVMTAALPSVRSESWRDRATQWFIVSDLGLTAMSGRDAVHGFVRSLATGEPVADAKVRLIARNNEILGEAVADAKGHVRFSGGLARGEGAEAPAVLVAEHGPGDYAFLDLTTSAFDLSDRGVGGRAAPGPLDAFLTAERGVYRPGADVHLTALLRDSEANAVPDLPLTLIVTRPDGVEHTREVVKDAGAGGRSWSMGLSKTSMTGTWRVRAEVAGESRSLATTSFLVEDFVPERLALELEPDTVPVAPGGVGRVKVVGKYLYGPPAVDLAIAGDVLVRPSTTGLKAYPGYQFGLDDEQVAPVRASLPDLPRTDGAGRADVPVVLPAIPRTSRILEAVVALQLREAGGQQIERGTVLPVAAQGPLVGIKPLFKPGDLDPDTSAEFEVVMLNAATERVPANLTYELVRLETRYQWYRRGDDWAYEAVNSARRIADGEIDVTADGDPATLKLPVSGGRYRLQVARLDGQQAASSVAFTAGWWTSGDAVDTPEFLDVALDRDTYEPGETARITLATKDAGRALVTVLDDDLRLAREVDVPAGGLTFDLPVDAAWGSGAYVTVQFYRPLDTKARRMPSRSIGVAWLPIDHGARKLKVEFDVPERVRSGRRMDVPLTLGGLTPGSTAYVTVAAVDIGVLNLTRFKTPEPEAHYFSQQRLGVELRDLYGRLIDGMAGSKGRTRSGGDGGLAQNSAPPVEKPLALFSGVVPVDADGNAIVAFNLPEFTGAIRLMAMAWSDHQVGHGAQDVIVRDPLALLVTAPRFLTLGDETRIGVDVHNVELPEGQFDVAVRLERASSTASASTTATPLGSETLTLAADGRRFLPIPIRAEQVGSSTIVVSVTDENGLDLERRVPMVIKAPAPFVRRQTRVSLAPGTGRFTVGPDLFTDLVADRSSATIAVGAAADLDVARLSLALDQYAYGCAEQTTSRALPLLYLSSVSEALGTADRAKLEQTLAGAVTRVFELQDSSGAFGLWSPFSGDLWLTAYVTDFLTRAREQQIAVPDTPFRMALDRLRNRVSYAGDFNKGGEDVAYALYVLARNGEAPVGDLRYYHDERLDRFATPLAKAHIGAALAMVADRERAQSAFRAAMADLDANPADKNQSPWRTDYGSDLRDRAAMLTLASETRVVARQSLVRLTGLVKQALSDNSHTSTQENAWTLLAAHGLMENAAGSGVLVDGEKIGEGLLRTVTAERIAAAPVTLSNGGDEPIDAVITVSGASLTPEPPASNGLAIERAFYGLSGELVDLASVTQNARVVAVLTVKVLDGAGGRLLVEDRLPAGFEIENPRLLDSASLKALPWLRTTVRPEHSAFAADKFAASLNLWRGSGAEKTQSVQLAYTLRAVSPGTFVHPPASVEDMYRPVRFARTATGDTRIAPAK